MRLTSWAEVFRRLIYDLNFISLYESNSFLTVLARTLDAIRNFYAHKFLAR